MNIQCSDGSRSFAKQTTALKMSAVAGHQKLMTPIERIIEADPLNNYMRSCFIWHLKQSGKVKKLNKGCLHELTANQKKVTLKCPFLSFYATTTNHFSIRLGSALKSVFHMATGGDQLSGCIEQKLQSTPQSQTCTKKRLWSLFGGLLLV